MNALELSIARSLREIADQIESGKLNCPPSRVSDNDRRDKLIDRLLEAYAYLSERTDTMEHRLDSMESSSKVIKFKDVIDKNKQGH